MKFILTPFEKEGILSHAPPVWRPVKVYCAVLQRGGRCRVSAAGEPDLRPPKRRSGRLLPSSCGLNRLADAERSLTGIPPVLKRIFDADAILTGGVSKHGYKTYLSAQEAPWPEGPRLPQEDGYRQRPQGSGPPPRQGPRASVLLSTERGRHLNNVFRDGWNFLRFLRP